MILRQYSSVIITLSVLAVLLGAAAYVVFFAPSDADEGAESAVSSKSAAAGISSVPRSVSSSSPGRSSAAASSRKASGASSRPSSSGGASSASSSRTAEVSSTELQKQAFVSDVKSYLAVPMDETVYASVLGVTYSPAENYSDDTDVFLRSVICKNCTYKVLESKRTESSGTVKVEFTNTDMNYILEKWFAELMRAEIEEREADPATLMKSCYDTYKSRKTVQTVEMHYKYKADGSWSWELRKDFFNAFSGGVTEFFENILALEELFEENAA